MGNIEKTKNPLQQKLDNIQKASLSTDIAINGNNGNNDGMNNNKEQSFANKVKKSKGKGRIKVKEVDNLKQKQKLDNIQKASLSTDIAINVNNIEKTKNPLQQKLDNIQKASLSTDTAINGNNGNSDGMNNNKEQSFANKVKKGKGKGRIKVKEVDNLKQTTVKIDQVDGNNNDDKSAAMTNAKAKKSGFEIPRR